MKKNLELLSIIIPIYNEEEIILNTYKNLKEILIYNNYNYEIIFINDGSKDNSLNILKFQICKNDNNCKIINFSRNFGQQKAISAGLNYCNGDCIIIMDADGQDPPEIIPKMITLWQNENDIVYAKRNKRKGETFFKKFTAKYFYKILNILSDIKIPKDTGDFRLIDRKVCENFNKFKEKDKYIRGIIAYEGFNSIELKYDRPKRLKGETKYTLKKMIKLALDGIYSFSYKPLYIEILINFIFILVSFIYLLYLLLSTNIKYKENRHFLYLLSLISISFFIKSLNNKYIENIHENTLNRPEYIIESFFNF